MSFAALLTSVPAIDVARSQFGFVIAFHIIFPAFSIGHASFLSVLEGAWLFTGRAAYLDAFKHQLKIFAMIFGAAPASCRKICARPPVFWVSRCLDCSESSGCGRRF